MAPLTAMQLSLMLESMKLQLEKDGTFPKIKQVANAWLDEKRAQFSGELYKRKLRENACYFFEATGASVSVLVTYLREGEPDLPHSDIQTFVNYVGRVTSQQFLPEIQAYVNGELNNYPCDQWSGVGWDAFRRDKQPIDETTYTKRLEFYSRQGQVGTMIADTYLSWLLSDPAQKGVAFSIPYTQVHSICDTKIQTHTSSCLLGYMLDLGNGRIALEGGKVLEPKPNEAAIDTLIRLEDERNREKKWWRR